MSEVYTYQELRELALKYGIRDNKVHIGVWLQTQGYQKQRIQINHIRKTFYLKWHLIHVEENHYEWFGID